MNREKEKVTPSEKGYINWLKGTGVVSAYDSLFHMYTLEKHFARTEIATEFSTLYQREKPYQWFIYVIRLTMKLICVFKPRKNQEARDINFTVKVCSL